MAGAGRTVELSRAEKLSLAVARLLNENPTGKRVQSLFHRGFGRHWARLAIGRRLLADDIEWLLDPPRERGVLLAINHLSFFDLFAVTLALYELGTRWMKNIYYPVRSNFFYEHPLGMAVNVLIGGGTLYPPIFRDPAKSMLNKDAIERLSRFLADRDTMVGLHPEGTRNKGDDPYQLLPAQPGAGQIALLARPLVVPVFVNGMGNDALRGIATSWRPDAPRTQPIIIVFGRPIAYDDLLVAKPRAALYKQMADRMRAGIMALGDRERDLRARCASGAIGLDDPRWIARSP